MCGGGEHSVSHVIIFINFLSDLLLHGYEALLEREIQESVLRGYKFHHDLQPELHGGHQPVELLRLHQHFASSQGTGGLRGNNLFSN